MLSDGIAPGNRTGAYLHRDRINHRLRARRSARIAAITSGGAIPEMADYRVVTEGERTFVGTLNEDFAIESQAGNVFQLGNTSWRIVYVRGGEVTVRDAHGARRRSHFGWAKRPDERRSCRRSSRNCAKNIGRHASESVEQGASWLQQETGADDWAARQAANYVAAQAAAMDVIPTPAQSRIRAVFR